MNIEIPKVKMEHLVAAMIFIIAGTAATWAIGEMVWPVQQQSTTPPIWPTTTYLLWGFVGNPILAVGLTMLVFNTNWRRAFLETHYVLWIVAGLAIIYHIIGIYPPLDVHTNFNTVAFASIVSGTIFTAITAAIKKKVAQL